MESKSFFNLPAATLLDGHGEKSFLESPQKHALETNWKTFVEQDMSKQSLFDVFAGTTPAIRQKNFLSQEECRQMTRVLESHKIVSSIFHWSFLMVVITAEPEHRGFTTLITSGLA
jgi:hypothetical protein